LGYFFRKNTEHNTVSPDLVKELAASHDKKSAKAALSKFAEMLKTFPNHTGPGLKLLEELQKSNNSSSLDQKNLKTTGFAQAAGQFSDATDKNPLNDYSGSNITQSAIGKNNEKIV